ncbi:unnamed protein product [Schistosoma margrebowiei]|uniref:Uncharacterized protein n=1 Tax=Schistosoma margrebowiei TaxID=48269 RepID=A0A183LD52_9TREM|nr:unnamed protein product [Schistosoma margrebowiei]
MVVGGSQQEILPLGTRQQGKPVILRELCSLTGSISCHPASHLVNQNNLIQYEQFINQLNWKNYEIKELSIQPSLDYIGNMNIDWLPISKGDMPKSINLSKKSKIDKINYKQLINDLFMKDLFHSSID